MTSKSVRSYVQDKVRPGTGREGALGYERYVAGAGMRRSDWYSFAQLVRLNARAYREVFTVSPGKLIPIPAPPRETIRPMHADHLPRKVSDLHS